ncbi:MAG: PLP-dependent aminotransferase family protein [Planctomycetaceae bacterium]
MKSSTRSFQPGIMAQRASEQAIGFLMQQGLENADCLSLAAGFVDPVTLPVDSVRQVAQQVLSQTSSGRIALQYGTTQGAESLRSALRRHLADLEGPGSRAADLPLERLVLTTGSQQLLALVTQALFNEGDICLVAAPTYFVYLGVLDGVAAKVIPIHTDDSGMCPQALEVELRRLSDAGQLHRVKLVYVVSDHDNPAGISVSAERRPQLVDTVRRWSTDNHIFLLEDAAYRELRYDGPHLPSLWSYDNAGHDDRAHVILAQTFSKSFAPGLRVGFGVLPQELVKPFLDLKGNEDFGSTHLSQNIMASVLESGEYRTHVTMLQNSYRLKRDAMLTAAEKWFADIDGVTWLRPNGGLYVWMTLPSHIETGFGSKLFRQATEVNKVMYVPGELSYPSTWAQRPKNQMRLSFGVLDSAGIYEGMRRLAAAVRAVMAAETHG